MSAQTELKMAERLRELLLDYLQAGKVFAWPGGDGLRKDDVLGCYPEVISAGKVPDWQELRRRHPELVPALKAFLASKAWVENRVS
jgi:hypothetical protein